ncbi:helix-turn-helix domain-containing protein, partial [Teichococcus deserti]|uniref:helix-turn-helix domain-containing protein n=1 Tax=Teichococcus deserti TaxID=1817963 RepID=UPI0013F62EB8
MPYDLKPRPRSDSQPAEAARVGEELREARLSLGVSLEELAEALRINRRYLAALEEGRVRDLPGVAYGTGFVRSYAQSMGLDAPDLVRRFREGAGGGTRSKDLVFPEPVPDRGVPAGVVILIGAVLAVGAYAAWYQWSGSAERSVDAVPPLPPRLEQAAREAGAPPLPGTPPANTPSNGAGPASPPAASVSPASPASPPAMPGAGPNAPAPGVTPAVPPAARPGQPPAAGTPAAPARPAGHRQG